MDLICQGEEKAGIYEDGDYWVGTNSKGETTKRILKSKFPYWPLSAVLKFGMTPVNMERLKELSLQFSKEGV
jgi:hypothetical protein